MTGTDFEITTLGELVEENARRYPGRTAVNYAHRSLSFAELDTRSNRVANGLIAQSLDAQSRVAIMDRNAETFFDILFGVAKANSVLVTVNFRLAAPEVEYILADSGAALLFVGAEFVAQIESLMERLPKLKKIIVLSDSDAAQSPTGTDFDSWCGQFPGLSPDCEVSAENSAVQMYTSGTTGNPKGVELSHRAMINAALAGLSVWPVLHEPDSSIGKAIASLIARVPLGFFGIAAGSATK